MTVAPITNSSRRRRLFRLPAILLLLLWSTPTPVVLADRRIPVRHMIDGKETECIYERLVKNDVATFSVFVLEALNNGKPRASVRIEGPVAGNKDIVPWKVDENGERINEQPIDEGEEDDLPAFALDQLATGREIRRSLLNDWPSITGPHAPDGVVERRFKVDWTHAGESEDAEAARSALMEQNAEEYRRHRIEHGDGEGEGAPPVPLHTVAQKYIDAYQETKEVAAHGWYRLCVSSDLHPLLVEMDIRVADKLKGVDPGTGHVYTYSVREYLDEQKEMFGEDHLVGGKEWYDTKDGHRQASDDDFKESKIKLRYMHDLTSEIMKSQHQRMHRIRAHDADARRGAAELAWSGKLETLLYVLITGLQCYTVHKWLLGNLLG